ncbi:hypothetical protein BD779DRAFT_1678880 [Infundibulicybe gibba]|nr:hypothetical protein BD779DRAFT_1678880 [Infundibulicybe gibba]
MTWQTGSVYTIRDGYRASGGKLNNTEDNDFRAISDNWPIFAFSTDLGNISAISTPLVWALGLVRDPTIQYSPGDGSTQQRSSYFWTQYKKIGEAVRSQIDSKSSCSHFDVDWCIHPGFPNARQRAIDLDQRITSDALSISQDYMDLVSLSARQAVGGVDITISNGTDGRWNESDVTMFMKSVGSSSRTNPTEVMFAAFPAYLYLNASWAGLLLRPSLQQQAAALPASAYATPDLVNAEALAIESKRDFHSRVIVYLLYAVREYDHHGSGTREGLWRRVFNKQLSSSSSTPLESWADYLAANALNRTTFISADGQNNPNLAMKGIIGVRAMGEISQLVGRADDASQFKDKASTMCKIGEPGYHRITSPPFMANHASWGLIYNSSQTPLELNFINQTIYNDQTVFYTTQMSAAGPYGIPYDSSAPDQVKSHWTMLTAATAVDNITRDGLMSFIHARAWLQDDTSQLEFLTDYNAVSGAAIGKGGRSRYASPGSDVRNLALNLPEQSIQASVPGGGGGGGSGSGGGNPKPDTGVIVGAVLASVAAITLAGSCLLLWRRRRKHHQKRITAPSLSPFSLI